MLRVRADAWWKGGRGATFSHSQTLECALDAPIRARGWPLSGRNYPPFWQEEAINVVAIQDVQKFTLFCIIGIIT
jgi:hypothetical protein